MIVYPVGETVLVTGASGFVGAWVLHLLLRRGYKVRGAVRSQCRRVFMATISAGDYQDSVDQVNAVSRPSRSFGHEGYCETSVPLVVSKYMTFANMLQVRAQECPCTSEDNHNYANYPAHRRSSIAYRYVGGISLRGRMYETHF